MKALKIVSGLLAVNLLIGGLAACDTQDTPETSESSRPAETSKQTEESSEQTDSGGDDTSPTTIRVLEHATSFEPALQEVIKAYNAQSSNIEVDYEIKAETYYSLLNQEIQSGDAPDLFWTNGTATSNMADLVSNDVLEPLDELDFSALTEESLTLSEIDGIKYSVPWLTMDTRAAYYNKTLFEENGWEVPSKFSEFEDLLTSQKESGLTPISLSVGSFWSILFAYEPLLSAMEPDYTKGLADYSSKMTDQPAANVLNKMLDWADAGYFGDNYKGVVDNDAAILAFTMGRSAMFIGGSWEMATIRTNNPELNFGAFQIPSETGETGMVGTSANGFSVNANSKNKEAAMDFAQFCATLEAQEIWVNTLNAVSASPDIESSDPVANEIADADNIYTSWQSLISKHAENTGEANAIVEEYMPKIFIGDITVDQLMEELAEQMK